MPSETKQKVDLANKIIGAMLREARLDRKENVKECAELLNLNIDEYEAIEYGERPITLPQLELLTYHLDQPLEPFLKHHQASQEEKQDFLKNRTAFLTLRHKLIGAMLRQARLEANIALDTLAQEFAVNPDTIEAYELGEEPVPLPILELLAQKLKLNMEELLDQKGAVARKKAQADLFKSFIELPADLQQFLTNPENLPYLRAAQKLSQLPKETVQIFMDSLSEMIKH